MMKAQRHEVEAWVNPSAWENTEDAERVIEAIIAADSDSEAEWTRIAGGGADDIAAAVERDELRREAEGTGEG